MVTCLFFTVWTDMTANGFNLELDPASTTLTIAPDETQASIFLITALTTTSSHTITFRGLFDVKLVLALPKPPATGLGAIGVPALPPSKTIPVMVLRSLQTLCCQPATVLEA